MGGVDINQRSLLSTTRGSLVGLRVVRSCKAVNRVVVDMAVHKYGIHLKVSKHVIFHNAFLSFRAVQQLSRLNGNQLFAMSRRDLIAAFGKAEGIRLDSQITISRNSAGFQTAKTSELRDILAKARRRTDENVKKEFDTSNA